MRAIARWMSRTGIAATAAFALTAVVHAQSARPANATAQCKDGSYSTAKTERGACSAHGGVQTWFGDKSKESARSQAPKPATKAAPSASPKGSAAPANATGQCQDGTYTTANTQRGACSGHAGGL